MVLLYHDESGCDDFDLGKAGNSRYLAHAVVVVRHSQRQALKRAVKSALAAWNANRKSVADELKAAKMNDEAILRTLGIFAALQEPPIVHTNVINKATIRPNSASFGEPRRFYNYTLGQLLKRIPPALLDEGPCVDFSLDQRESPENWSNTRWYLEGILQDFKKAPPHRPREVSVVALDSKESAGIQVADLFAHVVWSQRERGELELYRNAREIYARYWDPCSWE